MSAGVHAPALYLTPFIPKVYPMAKTDRAEAMTAGMKKGEPNPAAQEEVEKANAQARELAEAAKAESSELTPLVEVAPAVTQAPVAAGAPPATDLAQLFKDALADPGVKDTLRDVLTSDPSLRSALGIQAGVGAASGEWMPNYQRIDNHVMGGLEVEHDPGFTPLPPAAIPLYVTDDRFKAQAKSTTSLQHLAQKDAQGNAVKTEQYKLWLDLKMAGRNMSRNQLIDIEKQTEGAPQLAIGDDGAPIAMDGAGAQVEGLLHDQAL